MFNNLFKKNSTDRKSGIYKFSEGKLIELDVFPGDGSINSIIKSLSFELSQVHTIFTFDSKAISTLGVKILTKEPVFAIAQPNVKNLTISDLKKEIETIDWQFEYSSSGIDSILNDGLENGTLDYNFLSKVTKLEKESESIYHAIDLKLYLHFNNGILTSFASSDWLSTASKWLKSVNSHMFEGILSEAKKYHSSEIEAMEEVNLQCDALRSIPNVIKNEFISLHLKNNGNINFYNILLAHYNHKPSIDEFRHLNKGRFMSIDENTLVVDNFSYEFNDEGYLQNVQRK